MSSIHVLHSACPQNHPCPSVQICLFGALEQSGFAAPTVNKEKCTGCGQCVRFCPMGALIHA